MVFRVLYFKGLDVPSSIPIITRGLYDERAQVAFGLLINPLKIINLYYIISDIFYFKNEGLMGG